MLPNKCNKIKYLGVFMYFIYKIENKVNGKLYVGQTICPANRKKQHLSKTFHGNPALDRAVIKYGRNSFDFSIVEELETLDQANEKEFYWIRELNSLVPNGYNLKEGGAAGGPDSLETRQKKSQSKLGSKNHFYGRKHSEESKRKISESKKGKKLQLTEEDLLRRKIQKTFLGKIHSSESKIKMSKSRSGEHHYFYGKTHSEETKRKMAAARRKWWIDRQRTCETK